MRTLIAALAALLIAACASKGDWVAPRLSIVDANMISADVFSQQFRVRVHVQNPNPHDLPVKRIEYKLFLEGDSFADGQTEAAFVVPANGESEFDLLLNTNFISSIGRLLSHLTGTNNRTVHYNFEGTVFANVPFSPKFNFNEAGTVDLGK